MRAGASAPRGHDTTRRSDRRRGERWSGRLRPNTQDMPRSDSSVHCLLKIEKKGFGRLQGGECQLTGVFRAGPVAGIEFYVIQLQ
jgi:hypothetical protein